MKTTKDHNPLIVCYVSGNDDAAIEMCKKWIEENGFTSETHRLMRGITGVWVEER